MSSSATCIFCQIGAHQLPCHQILEDDKHIVFLNIFPNTEGFSVAIPKAHHVSDFAQAPLKTVTDLVAVARTAATKICRAYDDVERCAMVFEGLMVDHLHIKIIPLHHTVNGQWQKFNEPASSDYFYHHYHGYISTQQSAQPTADDILARIAAKINQADG